MRNIFKSFKAIIYLSIYLSISYSPGVFGALPPSILNRTWEMPQIDQQGNSIFVVPIAGTGFNVFCLQKGQPTAQQLSIADTSVTANTVWASIMLPGTSTAFGAGVVVWCTPGLDANMKYATIVRVRDQYVIGTSQILTFEAFDFQSINSIRLATNAQNKIIAVWNMPSPSDSNDVAQYAIFSEGVWSSAQSLFTQGEIGGSSNKPAVPMVALDGSGNALFAMSYYDGSWPAILQNTLLAKYLSSSGTLGSLMTYSHSNIEPMALTSVQYAQELYCIVSNTLSSASNVTTYVPTTFLNKSLVNQITSTDGFVSGNPIFTSLVINARNAIALNLQWQVSTPGIMTQIWFEAPLSRLAGYSTSSTLNDIVSQTYGSSGAPYFGFLTVGSLIDIVFNLETNQVAFNQQIADFTPANSQISINDSGVVVIFYTDASGNVYTYRTTVGSSNPLVDAVRNYSRLKPQKGRF